MSQVGVQTKHFFLLVPLAGLFLYPTLLTTIAPPIIAMAS